MERRMIRKTTLTKEVQDILNRRFGKDSLFALATAKDNVPFVRAVNAYYEDGCFYVITHALSGKKRKNESQPHYYGNHGREFKGVS